MLKYRLILIDSQIDPVERPLLPIADVQPSRKAQISTAANGQERPHLAQDMTLVVQPPLNPATIAAVSNIEPDLE
jgi:hypothetical protein